MHSLIKPNSTGQGLSNNSQSPVFIFFTSRHTQIYTTQEQTWVSIYLDFPNLLLEGTRFSSFCGSDFGWDLQQYHVQIWEVQTNQLLSRKFRTSNGGACGMGKGHCFKASLICCHSLWRGSDSIFLAGPTKVGKINLNSS